MDTLNDAAWRDHLEALALDEAVEADQDERIGEILDYGQFKWTLHRHDGLCLRSGHVTARGIRDAERHAAIKGSAEVGEAVEVYHGGERPYYYLLVSGPLPELPADGSCPRCGAQRTTCGGPSDPHE